jgi:hypothetical protein
MAAAVEEEVLRFDIPVGDTHRVEVLNPVKDLLERALDLAR